MEEKKEELPAQLAPSDLRLLKGAMEKKRAAQVYLDEVTQHIAVEYRLDPSCKIDNVTGAITRTPPPEPKPVPEPLGGRE